MRISDWSSDVCSSDLSAIATMALRSFAPSPIRPRSIRSLIIRQPGRAHGCRISSSRMAAPCTTSLACSSRCSRSTMRSEEHTSELQSLMRISYAVFCLKKKTKHTTHNEQQQQTYTHSRITLTYTIKQHLQHVIISYTSQF